MIPNDFKAGAPISQVPASWFNKVASFLNNLVAGYGIKINKENEYPSISLDTSKVATLTTSAPEDIGSSSAVGTATDAARADHVHKLSTTVGTPTDCGDFSAARAVTQTAETLWEVGGADGATVLVLFKGSLSGTYTSLYVAKLTFSSAGTLTKIEAVADCGAKIAG